MVSLNPILLMTEFYGFIIFTHLVIVVIPSIVPINFPMFCGLANSTDVNRGFCLPGSITSVYRPMSSAFLSAACSGTFPSEGRITTDSPLHFLLPKPHVYRWVPTDNWLKVPIQSCFTAILYRIQRLFIGCSASHTFHSLARVFHQSMPGSVISLPRSASVSLVFLYSCPYLFSASV